MCDQDIRILDYDAVLCGSVVPTLQSYIQKCDDSPIMMIEAAGSYETSPFRCFPSQNTFNRTVNSLTASYVTQFPYPTQAPLTFWRRIFFFKF